jgi:hypothetical protein
MNEVRQAAAERQVGRSGSGQVRPWANPVRSLVWRDIHRVSGFAGLGMDTDTDRIGGRKWEPPYRLVVVTFCNSLLVKRNKKTKNKNVPKLAVVVV